MWHMWESNSSLNPFKELASPLNGRSRIFPTWATRHEGSRSSSNSRNGGRYVVAARWRKMGTEQACHTFDCTGGGGVGGRYFVNERWTVEWRKTWTVMMGQTGRLGGEEVREAAGTNGTVFDLKGTIKESTTVQSKETKHERYEEANEPN